MDAMPAFRFILMVCLLCALSVASVIRSFIYRDGATLWEDAAEKSPQKARPHNNLGHELKNTWKLDEAARSFEQALALNPDYPDALNNLATIYKGTERRQEALALLRRSLDLNPNHLQAKHNLALQYYEMGMRDDAIREYNDIMRLSPFSKEAAFAGQMLLMMQNNAMK